MHKWPSNEEIIRGVDNSKSIADYARQLGYPRRTVSTKYHNALRQVDERLTKSNFFISCAQINTPAHEGFLKNVKAMCESKGAAILISGFTYNKDGMGHDKMGNADNKDKEYLYDPSLNPYMTFDRVSLNKKLEFMGSLNILPTATHPLSGLQTHTDTQSAIIPHPKITLESVPTLPGKLAKLLMTTGCMTYPNYMQKKAGQKAEKWHTIGGLWVEIVNDKHFHVRQIMAEEDGSFYDLTDRWEDGKLSTGHRVESIAWGDTHYPDVDNNVAGACWFSTESMLNILKPKDQFFHDLLDFKCRNHHNRDDAFFIQSKANERVRAEIEGCAHLLINTSREWCKSHVVASNHDNAYERWVREVSASEEPNMDNAIFLLQSKLAMYESYKTDKKINMFEWASAPYLRRFDHRIHFMHVDESFRSANGIEYGMHGDKGPNGARGSVKSFARIGTPSFIGHGHQATIFENCWMTGITRTQDAGYNKGPSSWSHTQGIEYSNGKRCLVTIIDGQWCKNIPEEASVRIS